MSAALRSCALLLAAATAAGAADPEAEELLKQARAKVLDNTRRMPRYTCVETISRTQYQPVDRSSNCRSPIAARGNLMARDRLRLDVAVMEDGEIFSWAGARKFETHDLRELAGGGASSTGEFATFLAGVFGSAPGAFRYAGQRSGLAIFEYDVPVAKSNYSYRVNGPGRTIGYHGAFSVDPSDGDLRQLVVEAEHFASGDAVCRVQHTIDYNRLKIGSGDFLLPEVSTMDALYRGGAESLNETRFSDCREYTGESSIHFGEVDSARGPATAAKVAPHPLPSKARLLIGLSKPIDTETAAAGDPVDAVLLRDVIERKQGTIAKANDRVHGRILGLRQFMEPEPRWYAAIRFDTIERNGVEQPIALKPVDDGDRSTPRLRTKTPQRPEGGGVFIFAEHGNLLLDQTFHSEWETR